jgi:2,4-dienoyl-CoA reductase (NADPH2)
LAQRGHHVSLFDKSAQIGGQFNLAKQIPGKEEFHETIRYFKNLLVETGVSMRLGETFTVEIASSESFDEVVVATGIKPRELTIQGIDHSKVLSYIDAIREPNRIGKRVAIIGAGGIGFDVAELLCHRPEDDITNITEFNREWGVDQSYVTRGAYQVAKPSPPAREVTLMQRKSEKLGKSLGKTTGWIHRASLAMKRVQMISGANYLEINDNGLIYQVGSDAPQLLECDSIIVCAGQVSQNELKTQLDSSDISNHLIGGALLAGELDAKRAIRDGFVLASRL